MFLVALLIVTKAVGVVANTFQQVSSTSIYWDSLQTYKDSSNIRLHCILDEQNQLGIVNVTWKLIEPGKCPYYDRISGEIHARPCDNSTGKCPKETLFSYQAVKYSACYAAEKSDMGDSQNGSNVSCAKCGSYVVIERTTVAVFSTLVVIVFLQLVILMIVSRQHFGNIIRGISRKCRRKYMNRKTPLDIKEDDSERDMKTKPFLYDSKECKPRQAISCSEHTPYRTDI